MIKNSKNYQSWKEQELWSAAQKNLIAAAVELEKIATSDNVNFCTEEAKYYRAQINEILSGDGASGIDSIIRMINQRII